MSWFDISWPELGKEKVSLKTRTLIETEVQKIHEKTEIKVSDLVAFAGVSKSTWHERKSRKGIETRHNHETPKFNWYTPEERTAVVKYVLTHKNFMYGYRYLAWQMIDENVAFVRPASVYNIMKEYDLSKSNGKLERFHSTLKTEHVRKTPYFSYEDAKEKMAQWIDFYNSGRLHGALFYLTPADYFEGRKESRLAERREKLHTADINRKAYWLQQQHS